MADIAMRQILAKLIQTADEAVKTAEQAIYFPLECRDIKVGTEKLATLLRLAVRASGHLYEHPTRRITDATEKVLDKALTHVYKCRANVLRRIFTIIPITDFPRIWQKLGSSIGDVMWLLNFSTPAHARGDEYLGLPAIAANEPILWLIWEQIAILRSGCIKERTDAAAFLVILAEDNDRNGRLIVEEGGVPPLLKLAKEGGIEGQVNAGRAIGLLGRDPKSVDQIMNAGVWQVFAKILKEGHVDVQIVVAWAASELASRHHEYNCQV